MSGRKIFLLTVAGAAVLTAPVLFALWADKYIGTLAAGRIYTDLERVPKRDVALVLGTSKYAYGLPNPFYTTRIRAAAELYNAGKVDAILVSGDNGSADYNEPGEMKSDLVALGIPEAHVTADYAGFRTLDSVYRAGEVFGLQSYTIVSQPFHLARALYLADRRGQDAIGFAARTPRGYSAQRVRAREVLARAMAVLDVELLGREPRFLGEPVPIPQRDSDGS